MSENIAIKLQGVSKSFSGLDIISSVDMKVREQEFISILGPSGCGKTTILKLIAGLEDIDAGSIYINGNLVSDKKFTLAPEKRNIGMVFQDYALFPHLSVEENIAFGLRGGVKNNREEVYKIIAMLELSGKEKMMPYKLSGGEQQRVAVGRTLAPKPKIILLDESFSSLDAKLRLQLREMVYLILRDQQVTAILVTHDQSEAFSFSDKVFLMKDGRILQYGSPRDVYENPSSDWVASFVGETNILGYEGKGSKSIVEGNKQQQGERIIIRPEDIFIQKDETNSFIHRIQYLAEKICWAINFFKTGVTCAEILHLVH